MCEYGTLRGLITFYVKSLQLNKEAPYPTLRIEAMKDIKRYQMSQAKTPLHIAEESDHVAPIIDHHNP